MESQQSLGLTDILVHVVAPSIVAKLRLGQPLKGLIALCNMASFLLEF